MAVEAPAANQAPLLYRTAPFSSMESARRFQLLWQSRAVQYSRGESVFPADAPPTHVLIIFDGHVSVFGELPAEPGPILLDVVGAGGCAGWSAALSGVPGVCAVATSEVNGLLIPAPAFLEITRYDPAIRAALYSKPWKAEVWRAALSEMERRTGTVRSARAMVDTLLKESVAKDWPEDEAEISAGTDYVWVVVGGEGVAHGERWTGGDGALWARLIGLPELKLNEALIAINALATVEIVEPVEPEVSPSRSDENLPTPEEKLAAVSSSEVRNASPEPSRSAVARVEERAPTTGGRGLLRGFALVIAVLTFIGVGVGWWASQQRVVRTVSLPAQLTFAGQTRALTSSVGGTLIEFNIRAGERLQPGAVLAVVRPPFDESRYMALRESLNQTKLEADYCENFLSGAPVSESGVPAAITALTREYARLSSESRVLAAITNGEASVRGLAAKEVQRVRAHFAALNSSRADRLEGAARDASTRFEDLREAEQSLREAQEEVRSHQQSFSGAVSQDKKEAAQEIADYRRVLAVLNREVARRQENVNRLRREINLLKAEAVPVAAPMVDDRSADLLNVQSGIAKIEVELRQRADKARKIAADTEASMERIRAEGAPRQIICRAPGRVAEVPSLAIGAEVMAETTLAQLVVREGWLLECAIPFSHKERLAPGQSVRITYVDKQGKPASAIESLMMIDGPTPRLRLNINREEWREGMQVNVETELVMGSLLDQWLGRIPPVL